LNVPLYWARPDLTSGRTLPVSVALVVVGWSCVVELSAGVGVRQGEGDAWLGDNCWDLDAASAKGACWLSRVEALSRKRISSSGGTQCAVFTTLIRP